MGYIIGLAVIAYLTIQVGKKHGDIAAMATGLVSAAILGLIFYGSIFGSPGGY